jgi:hypothetical protein
MERCCILKSTNWLSTDTEFQKCGNELTTKSTVGDEPHPDSVPTVGGIPHPNLECGGVPGGGGDTQNKKEEDILNRIVCRTDSASGSVCLDKTNMYSVETGLRMDRHTYGTITRIDK